MHERADMRPEARFKELDLIRTYYETIPSENVIGVKLNATARLYLIHLNYYHLFFSILTHT